MAGPRRQRLGRAARARQRVVYGLEGQKGHFSTQDPRVRPLKRYKTNGMATEWHTGIVEDEVGHSGAKQLFSGLLVWSIFYNGTQVKSSLIRLSTFLDESFK